MKIQFGEGPERTATFNSANARTITYTYTVQGKVAEDVGDNGVVAVSSYTGTVYDRAGNDLVLTSRRILSGSTITADTTNPIFETVKVVTPDNGTYKAGQEITLEAIYSENVYGPARSTLINETAPILKINFRKEDGTFCTERTTKFKSVNGNVITYTYIIESGDN